jgi:hypothetical protein
MKKFVLPVTLLGLALAASCDSDPAEQDGPDDGSAATGGGGSGGKGGSGGDAGGGGSGKGGGGSSGNGGGGSSGKGGGGGDAGGGDGGDAGRTGGAGGSDAGAPGEGGQSGESGGGGTGPGVTARVVNDVNLPISGVTVTIGGARLTTNAAGEVTVPSVPETYDAVVINPEPSIETAIVYQGLTRRDPVFRVTRPEGTEHTPTLSGTTDVPGTESVELLFGTSEVWKVSRALNDGSFSILPKWSGPASTTGTLHLLRWNVAGGAPSSYTGYGSVPVTMTGANQQVTLHASPITSGSVSGTLLAPSASGLIGRAFYAALDAHTLHHITSQTSASLTFTNVVTPAVPGAQIQIWATATTTGNSGVRSIRHYPTTASNIELDIPAGPTLTSPADGAMQVTLQTPFVWSPLEGAAGVCALEIRGTSNQRIRIVTSETTTTLPIVPGFVVPPDTTLNWNVTCYAPFDGVDEFASLEAGVDLPEFKRVTRVRSNMQNGTTLSRQFRTSP